MHDSVSKTVTKTVSKSAFALTLAALAVFGVTACSSGGSSNASDKSASSSGSSGSSKSEAKSTPKAGLSTKVQCAELNAKLNDSANGLEDAMSDFDPSSTDPGTLVPQLQKFQSDLDTQVGKVTDPALKAAAGKVDTDFDSMVSSLTTALNDIKAGNTDDAQTQISQVESLETTMQSDSDALQNVCKI